MLNGCCLFMFVNSMCQTVAAYSGTDIRLIMGVNNASCRKDILDFNSNLTSSLVDTQDGYNITIAKSWIKRNKVKSYILFYSL